MGPTDKMQLLKLYRDKKKSTGMGTRSVEIGSSQIQDSLAVLEGTPTTSTDGDNIIRPDAELNGEKFLPESEPYTFDTNIVPDDTFIDDGMFRPVSFEQAVVSKDDNSKNLYEELKSGILGIDCTKGLDHAYTELDNMLQRMSGDASNTLTNNQLLVLISTMIVKLEELNGYNYPEISLSEVKNKLESDGKRVVYGNQFAMYFFEEFFKYYQRVEYEQFNKLKPKYNQNLEKFTEFQQRKGDMLMTLLKWLIN